MALNISIPETVVLSTRQTNKEFEAEAKRAIALKFYADEKLSLGQAAELAGFSKPDFMKYLGDNKVSVFRYDSDNYIDELQNDIKNAERYVQ
jgi:predicted HTH domain antitoxin